MRFQILLTTCLCFTITLSLAQSDPAATLRSMEGSWLLDTTTYEATYSPKLQLPVMRMDCEMTNSMNGLYCTWTTTGEKEVVIAGDYYALDKESGRIILLTTENDVAKITYGEVREGNILAYMTTEDDTVIFEAEMNIGPDMIVLHSVLHDFQGMTGESTMALFRVE